MQTLFQEPDDERAELLERAIEHLTADEQTLVTLFYYDDLPLADIGYITGQTPGTIATRLHRIRHKLYQLIKQIQDL
jgi:RNA polymerase sigma-70 factor (ECF subfamily)